MTKAKLDQRDRPVIPDRDAFCALVREVFDLSYDPEMVGAVRAFAEALYLALLAYSSPELRSREP